MINVLMFALIVVGSTCVAAQQYAAAVFCFGAFVDLGFSEICKAIRDKK